MTALNAAVMVLPSASTARAAGEHRIDLTFDLHGSVGKRSSQNGGRPVSLAPTASVARRTDVGRWAGRLSIHQVCSVTEQATRDP